MVEEILVMRDFFSDDRSGLNLPRIGAGARRLHRCRRGNVSLLVLFMGFVFYAMLAMVWNTGKVTSAKIEAQTAADAAAYSASVWTSRALNLANGTNMRILQNSTAITGTLAVIPAIFFPPIEWARAIKSACTGPCSAGPAAAIACPVCLISTFLLIFSLEIAPMWIPFVIEVVPALANVYKLFINIAELHQYQIAWQSAVPDAIRLQTLALEKYFDCDIEIIRGDGQAMVPPLHSGTPLTFIVPFFLRAYYEQLYDDPGWYGSDHLKGVDANTAPTGGFRWMFVGKAKKWYKRLWIISALVGWIYGGFNHVVLTTTPVVSPLEFGPGFFDLFFPSSWQQFTVVAAARKRTTNTESGQPPRYPLRFMASGLFKSRDTVRPIAYAQAESYLGIDGLFMKYIPFPYRVWSTWGWQWQPRLAHGNFVPARAGTIFPDLSLNAADIQNVATH